MCSQQVASDPVSEFLGSERFVIERRLGAGGMGVVYQAFDRERGEKVALKTLSRVDPANIYRLKHEFRALADTSHPNLVSLHELFSDGAHWYFTMELVPGVDFVTYVSEDSPSSHAHSLSSPIALAHAAHQAALGAPPTTPDIPPTLGEAAGPHNTSISPYDLDEGAGFIALPPEPDPPALPLRVHNVDYVRLRAALAQVAHGVSALHDSGKLHCDLKPSNVLVTRDGRVVILDFGLVQDRRADVKTLEDTLAGTPAYMAPEQSSGEPLTPMADWYALGVMLYVALTGVYPFHGTQMQILMAKQMRDALSPSQVVAGIPADLEALCVALLRRSPAERAEGRQMLLALGAEFADGAGAAARVRSGAVVRASRFVGRDEQLAALSNALAEAKSGKPVALYVHGMSGMGKTALVQHFLDGLRERDEAVILSGRCYERESVPFKAFDSVVDALSRYLRRLPRAEAFWLLPRGVHELARVFPSIKRVDAIDDVPSRTFEVPNHAELRRLAFAALKNLLARVVEKRPVVLYIDDLQWGDRDSAILEKELLAPPDPPALLIIGTYRTDEADASPFLREVFDGNPGHARRVFVGALPEGQAVELALALLDTDGAQKKADDATRARAAAMARESEGNPFFVAELARHTDERGAADAHQPTLAAGADVSLDQVLAKRIARLPADARALLEVIAVAGGPIAQGVAAKAAGLVDAGPAGDGRNVAAGRNAMNALRSAQLVRTRGAREIDAVETYHDRIRESVASRLDAAGLAERHLALAQAIEQSAKVDPEQLALHYRAGGLLDRAGEFAALAAARAADALAFERASALYRQALELHPGDAANARMLRTKLGDALLNAGRGADAAAVYQEVAKGAPAGQALDLRRRASEQLLISGHVDEGMDLLRSVLRTVDIGYPASSYRALAALLLHRAKLRVRGLRFREKDAKDVPTETLARIDICFSVSLGLSMVDTICAAAFQAHHLLLALDAGEPNRIALGLAFEAGHVSTAGGPERKRALELIAAAQRLADRLKNPQAQGFALLMSGVADWGVGRWESGLRSTEEAEMILRERCTGVAWEIDTAQLFSMICMTSLGDLEKLRRSQPAWLKEAEKRGDKYAAASLRTFWGAGVLLALADDDPARARKDIDDTMARWSQRGFHAQHYYALASRVMVDLYEGKSRDAHDRVSREWPALARSLLLRVQPVRITALYLRASAALAAAERGSQRAELLPRVERDARDLAGEKMGWSDPLAALLRAAAAHLERRGARQVEDHLDAAVRGFDAADMALYAAAARRRLGVLVGGDRGRSLTERADAFMRDQKIVDAARLTRVLAPGFDETPTPSPRAAE
jgi:hypothetical protein